MYYLGSHAGHDPNYAHSSSVMEKFTLKTTPPHMHRKILARGTHQEMIDLEIKLLNIRKERCWDRYYNVTTSFPPPPMHGDNHPNFGKKRSPETKEKLSKALSGANNPMYGKTGENNPNFGKKRSPETLEKMSKALSGANNPMYGKKFTLETRKKMSKAQTGKKASPETRKKMSKAKSGENHPMSRKNREARQRKKLEQEGIIQLDNYLK